MMATCGLARSGPSTVGHNWPVFHSIAGPALAVRDGAVMYMTTSARNGYPGTCFNTRYPGTRQIPGYPGITQYPCYLFHKVRDTLFLSDNLNTTARAVDASHLHHKAGIPRRRLTSASTGPAPGWRDMLPL